MPRRQSISPAQKGWPPRAQAHRSHVGSLFLIAASKLPLSPPAHERLSFQAPLLRPRLGSPLPRPRCCCSPSLGTHCGPCGHQASFLPCLPGSPPVAGAIAVSVLRVILFVGTQRAACADSPAWAGSVCGLATCCRAQGTASAQWPGWATAEASPE